MSWEEAARRARGTQDSPIPDQTRGILTFVRESCPANYHPEVQYVSVAGKYIKGAKIGDREASLLQQAIGAGYQAVCGVPDVWGDGVVPLPAAHLEGNPSPPPSLDLPCTLLVPVSQFAAAPHVPGD